MVLSTAPFALPWRHMFPTIFLELLRESLDLLVRAGVAAGCTSVLAPGGPSQRTCLTCLNQLPITCVPGFPPVAACLPNLPNLPNPAANGLDSELAVTETNEHPWNLFGVHAQASSFFRSFARYGLYIQNFYFPSSTSLTTISSRITRKAQLNS